MSRYAVQRVGSRWFVVARAHGVTVRLQGFATKQDAQQEARRRQERWARLINGELAKRGVARK